MRTGGDCESPQPYQSARQLGGLTAPEGLVVPEQRADRRIPEVSAGSQAIGRCLERPPQVLSNETVLALAERGVAARTAATSEAADRWPAAEPSAWVSIDPLEGADLTQPIGSRVPAWQIHDTLQAWASAWSRQETDPYFAFYAGSFRPEGGQTWSEWRNRRTSEVAGVGEVDVSVYGAQAQAVGPEKALLRFTERYRSGAGARVSRKEMLMIREADVWSIQRERELSQ